MLALREPLVRVGGWVGESWGGCGVKGVMGCGVMGLPACETVSGAPAAWSRHLVVCLPQHLVSDPAALAAQGRLEASRAAEWITTSSTSPTTARGSTSAPLKCSPSSCSEIPRPPPPRRQCCAFSGSRIETWCSSRHLMTTGKWPCLSCLRAGLRLAPGAAPPAWLSCLPSIDRASSLPLRRCTSIATR